MKVGFIPTTKHTYKTMDIYMIHMLSNRTIELFDSKDIPKDPLLLIIADYNINYEDIVEIRQVRLKGIKLYLIILKDPQLIKDTKSRKWIKFFKYCQNMKSNTMIGSTIPLNELFWK